MDDKDQEILTLRRVLADAIELVEEGIGYTGEYFVAKWRMQERLDAIKRMQPDQETTPYYEET